jgi:hypothetical protein
MMVASVLPRLSTTYSVMLFNFWKTTNLTSFGTPASSCDQRPICQLLALQRDHAPANEPLAG